MTLYRSSMGMSTMACQVRYQVHSNTDSRSPRGTVDKRDREARVKKARESVTCACAAQSSAAVASVFVSPPRTARLFHYSSLLFSFLQHKKLPFHDEMSEFKTPTTKKVRSRLEKNPEFETPIKIPASPFLKQIGYGCGMSYWGNKKVTLSCMAGPFFYVFIFMDLFFRRCQCIHP